MSEKHLYIDLSNICYRNIHSLAPDIKAHGFGIFRHSIITSVIYNIEKFNPDKVYICCDAPRNWRKKFYEPYKAHRKAAKDKFDIDWVQFSEMIEEVKMGFKSSFPFYVVQQDWLEADDVIAFLVRKYVNAHKTIVSSDSDFIQLLKYPNTKIFCPLKKTYIENDNPIFHLERKIVMGDKNSDNIPAIRTGLGPVRSEELIASGALDKLLLETTTEGEPTELVKNYKRNRKLIDLTKTPSVLIEKLELEMDQIKPASSKGVYEYIVKHKMRDLFYKISHIDKVMRKLNLPTSNSVDPSLLSLQSPNP
jgi:5'-3' exonuclease